MKKSFFFLTCIIGLLSLIGCSKDETYSSSGDTTKSTKIRWYGVKTSDKPTTRGVADEGNLWNQRVGIYVKFLNEPKDETKLDEIRQIAAEWEEYAGIKFHFVNGEAKANVRIAFDWQGNDWLTWSYTGTDAKTVTDQTQPTAVLAGADDANNDTFRGDVLRLFGQILGLEYEQRHQDWNAWKSEAQLQSYWEDQFDGINMDWDQIREYVFVPLTTENGVHTVQTDELDELSIMAWTYYTKRQTNKIIANFELSERDKSFIAKLYPKENCSLPTIQEAWVDAGFFTWTDSSKTVLKITKLGALQEYLPDVSDGEQLTSAFCMFSGGNNLKKAPKFSTSNITDFSHMFRYCTSLTSIPLLDTSKGTHFSYTFSECPSLTSIPLLDTSKGTNFNFMFAGSSIKTIPLINTSNGMFFMGMFSGTYYLTEIPLLDTSNGSDFAWMFSSSSITTIPLLNTSKGVFFYSMFSDTPNLKSIPLLNTSNGTNFSYMFASSTNLTNIPLLNTSRGTDFSFMFNECSSLQEKPQLDLSRARNTTHMYTGTPFDK